MVPTNWITFQTEGIYREFDICDDNKHYCHNFESRDPSSNTASEESLVLCVCVCVPIA